MLGKKLIQLFSMTLLGLSSFQVEAASQNNLPTGDTFTQSTTARKKCCNRNRRCKGPTFDYIIVGCGTAGSVLARKLTDDKKTTVLVLEAGENFSNDPVVLNPNFFPVINDLTFDPKYAVTYPYPLPESLLQTFAYAEGRMWGGSSAHNYLLAVRSTASLWNSWATLSGNSQWSYANILPFLKAVETFTGITNAPAQRGTNGPIFITQDPPVDAIPFAVALSTATDAPFVPDYNVSPQGDIGTSAYQNFVTPGPNSQRSFAVTGYLPNGDVPNPVVTPDGRGLEGRKLRILSDANVSRVLFDNLTANGVEFILSPNNEKAFKAFARKKVILCSGAIHSPAILQRSGIGDPALLNSLGIPVLVANPHVGAHVVTHPGAIIVISGSNAQTVQAMATGTPFFPNDGVRRLQILFNPGTPVFGYGFLMEPKSEGTVKIVSRNPLIYPKLDLNIYSDPNGEDAFGIVSLLKIAQTIAADFGETVLAPSPAVYAGGDAALLSYAKSNPNILITDHITATTRMAPSIANGVVDGRLHVFGVQNLMIVDLGIGPKIPNGNTCNPVYGIANLAAFNILNEG